MKNKDYIRRFFPKNRRKQDLILACTVISFIISEVFSQKFEEASMPLAWLHH